ncbi:MAG: hypothetical protein Hyperionvirus4_104 [Hyperionvirus sp.]|uniref:Sel1 repeat family protein n=1 Tax=Hyperionvirus sp. TaxID=2487770 RepID=A0A3G5ACR6_9VIRU|nr:MAG: hypothetical protein Hyperionvirus4_104 [Hyperionvirus sp.]
MGNNSSTKSFEDEFKRHYYFTPDRAREVCEKHIAANGNAAACYTLAMLYLNKANCDIDFAYKYLNLAVEQGHKEALINLGILYYYGPTIKENDRGSSFIDRDDYPRPFQMKKHYPADEKKAPMHSDKKKSFELFTQAEAHFKGAKPMLYVWIGAHYEYGYNVDACDKKALEYFEKAYVAGYRCTPCIYRLYSEYKSIDISTDECLYWILKADADKVEGANMLLIKIYDARKNYDLAIEHCSKELEKYGSTYGNYDSYVKCKLILASLTDKKNAAEAEAKMKSDKMAALEQLVDSMAKEITVLKSSMIKADPPVAVAVPLISPPPPPY